MSPDVDGSRFRSLVVVVICLKGVAVGVESSDPVRSERGSSVIVSSLPGGRVERTLWGVSCHDLFHLWFYHVPFRDDLYRV